MIKKGLLSIFFTLLFSTLFGQAGGYEAYKFLKLSPSARIIALGNTGIALKDDDINNAYINPSLLNEKMDNVLAFNTVNYLSDINYGYVAYGKKIGEAGTFDIGMHYVRYGDFTRTTAGGDETGNFTAGDYAFILGWGRKFDERISYGANLKTIYSSLDSYTSLALATDIGVTYYNIENEFTAAAVIKNIGYQLVSYRPGNRESLPLDAQIGISKKLQYAPFRFSLTAHDLQRFDLSYIDPEDPNKRINLATGEPEEQKISMADKIGRHLSFGVEALFSKNFNVRIGYDHQRRRELALKEKASTVGFSWGFGLKIKKINLSYGSAKYHLAGSTNQFSISVKINDFIRK